MSLFVVVAFLFISEPAILRLITKRGMAEF